jgi:CheY-like chemotaxis protein
MPPATQLVPEPLITSLEDGRSARRDVTVLVVDDQETFRRALRELIEGVPGFALVGEAGSGEEAADAVTELNPQLVLMDVVMPGMGGIAAARQIVSRQPTPMVVLISVDDVSVHPEAEALGDRVDYLRKQDLRPARLRALWQRVSTDAR